MSEPSLKLRQDASVKAELKMIEMLLGFDPVAHLTIGDAKCIANWCRTLAFNALCEVDEKENRK